MKLILIFVSLVLTVQARGSDQKSTVIYGQDDRRELFQISDSQILNLSAATFLIVEKNELEIQDDAILLNTMPLKEKFGLCPRQKYNAQASAGFCSGFLVGPNLAITAGHCITNEKDCRKSKFVFDFALREEKAKAPDIFDNDQIYSCKKLVHREDLNGHDFAIVELDRSVVGRTPLTLSSSDEVNTGQKLFMIGNPVGLPTKVTLNGKIRRDDKNYFVTDLDAFGGNSGSAVFDAETYQVLGILVRGENDYYYKPGQTCGTTTRCAQDGCMGEEVTHIGLAKPYINSN